MHPILAFGLAFAFVFAIETALEYVNCAWTQDVTARRRISATFNAGLAQTISLVSLHFFQVDELFGLAWILGAMVGTFTRLSVGDRKADCERGTLLSDDPYTTDG